MSDISFLNLFGTTLSLLNHTIAMQKMPKLMLDQDGTTYNVYCHYTHLSAPEQKESAANATFGVIKATDPAKYLMRGEDFGKAADSALLKSK